MSTADALEQVALIQLEKLMKSDKESTLGDCARALAVAWQIRQAERQFDMFRKDDESSAVTEVKIEIVDAS